MGGVLGLGLQGLMNSAVLFVGQVRGVARRFCLGLVDAGLEIRNGYFAHLEL